MKIYKNLFLVLCFYSTHLFAQGSSCENSNGDMQTASSTYSSGFTWLWMNNELDNWYTSHGSPIIHNSGGNRSIGLTAWTAPYLFQNGIYTEHLFKGNTTYKITYDVLYETASTPNSELQVQLVNGLVPTVTISTTPPTPVNSMDLPTDPWINDGTWRTVTKYITTGNNAFTQLWFRPYTTEAHPHADCRIDNVCVEEVDDCDLINNMTIEIFHELYSPDDPPADPGIVTVKAIGVPANAPYQFTWFMGTSIIGREASVEISEDLINIFGICLGITYYDVATQSCCSNTICIPPSDGFSPKEPGEQNGTVNLGDGSTIHVYPNPSHGEFNFSYNGTADLANTKVFDQKGAIVYELSMNNENSQYAMDLSHLNNGIYFMICYDQNGQQQAAEKIILSRNN